MCVEQQAAYPHYLLQTETNEATNCTQPTEVETNTLCFSYAFQAIIEIPDWSIGNSICHEVSLDARKMHCLS